LENPLYIGPIEHSIRNLKNSIINPPLMKTIMIAFLALMTAGTITAQSTDAQKKKVTDVAKFDKETYDFGKIPQNKPATATFTITNISKEPIVIEQANPTCGCTISDYTKTPIAPGQTGTIHATYNAAAVGAIHKTLTVKIAGIDEIKSISLAGEVIATPAADAKTDASTTPTLQPAATQVNTKVKATDNVDKTKTTTTTDTNTTKTKTKKTATKTKKKSTTTPVTPTDDSKK
jgi:hypothetical protein